MKICKVEECNNKTVGSGYCDKHYRRFKKHGDPLYKPPVKYCKIEGCNDIHYGKGLCRIHYDKLRNHGNPLYNKHVYDSLCSVKGCHKNNYSKGFCVNHYGKFKKHGDPLYINPFFHGLRETKEYVVWANMKQRCSNSKLKSYPRYGGRGIKVCDRWLNSFLDFYEDMGERPFKGAQIDRIDNDGNYEPGNCRWVTPKENVKNSTATKLTEDIVLKIRKDYEEQNITRSYLGKKYNISKTMVNYIINRDVWKEIKIG